MSTESPAAVEIVRTVSVPLSQARTFELFTTRMTDFWPKEHSIGSSEIAEVVVEPHTGGRWLNAEWTAANAGGAESRPGIRHEKWCCSGRSAPTGNSTPTSKPRSK